MHRVAKPAAVLTAALLILGVFGAAPVAGQELVSQVVCEATGWVFVPDHTPDPPLGFGGPRTHGIQLVGAGTCQKPAIVPGGDTVVFGVLFSGQGTTTRRGPCRFGVILDQDILVTVFMFPVSSIFLPPPVSVGVPIPQPVGPTRVVQQLWTTELNTGAPVIDVPSVYPPTHFQIRKPTARYSLRGAGAYTEPAGLDFKCPPSLASPAVPSVFAFTFSGADAQP